MRKKILFTDTTLRDGHQSLWATRMSTYDILPVLEQLDAVGYHSLEVWGGATFDVCIRFLNEDPWLRLKLIRQKVKKTKLQMLLRGQSLVGYTHYPDDIAERFVDKAAENGIDIFRVFDALNDLRNLETSLRAVKKTGRHAQACVVYTISPVHSLQHFLDTALSLQDMGADSICIKDMAGLLAPYASYDLVKLLKENLSIPVQLHTHYIGGLAIATLLKATEADVDVVDTASVPMAFGSSQPPVETVVRALQNTDHDTGMDLHALFEIAIYFEKLRNKKGYERGVTSISDMQVFEHQIPGGMISNFQSQLAQQNASERIFEVLAEIPRVREDLGYPPLVTPTSQMLGTQAVLNVLMNERYKMCPVEIKDYVKGLYGKPPADINDDIRKKIIGDDAVISVRPADLLEPYWDKAKNEAAAWAENDEDILTYALFPQVAKKFFEERAKGNTDVVNEDNNTDMVSNGDGKAGQGSQALRRAVRKGDDELNVDDIQLLIKALDKSSLGELEVQNKDYRLALRKSLSESGNSMRSQSQDALLSFEEPDPSMHEIISPMVGTFYAAPAPDAEPFVRVGERIQPGKTMCILEAMKLMNEIKADVTGTIVDVLVENAEAVEYGQVLFLIKKDF